MKRFPDSQIQMHVCPVCKKSYPKTLEFFFWCEFCRRWICKRCLLTCETCLLKYVCKECSEELKRKYHAVSDINRCESCQKYFSSYFNTN